MHLECGTRVGRYELRAQLGKGAMGVVYLAYDEALDRFVAVKVMLQADDPERLKRFRLEAKAASALNHRNILTVHDFGQDDRSHFIVTELIQGQTLRKKLSQRRLNYGEILEIAIQIGTGLSAAHAAGIIHRDIKPENVMVLADGHVKLLDFGLAKLKEPPEGPAPSPQDTTITAPSTGAIVGTINYMAPEQLRGQKVDERADVWSLGIVLYEMLAGKRPFEGESPNDVVAAILERPLPMLSTAPAVFQAILRQALSKDRQLRFKTAAEFVHALEDARQQLDLRSSLDVATGEAKAAPISSPPALIDTAPNSVTATKIDPEVAPSRFRKLTWIGLALFGLLAAVVGSYFLKSLFRGHQPTAGSIRMRSILTPNTDPRATISPDGRLYVYVDVDQNGFQSLRLGQVDVPGSQELIPPRRVNYRGITFANDGNWIYYVVFGLKSGTTSGTVYRMTILGGAEQPLADNVDSPIAIAPDGRRFAFFRELPEKGRDQLIVCDAEGQNPRVLSERAKPEFYVLDSRQAPAWSPDGQQIAVPAGGITLEGSRYMTLVGVNVQTAEERPLTSRRWLGVGRGLWLKDGKELIVTAIESDLGVYQIYRLTIPGGEVSMVLSDLRDYSNVSLSADGRLLAVATDKSSSIFTMSMADPALTSQIANGQMDGVAGLSWTTQGALVYVSLESRNRDLWIKSADNKGSAVQLTFNPASDYQPTVSPDGRRIVFVSNRAGAPTLWRMDIDGTNVRLLTDKSEASFPQITPDGQWVIFGSRGERPSLWKVSINGGEAVRLTPQLALWPALSSDGKWIACITKGDSIDEPMMLGLFSGSDFSLVKTFKIPPGVASPEAPALIRWLPHKNSIAYIVTRNGVSNIWAQPVSGAPATKLTDFTTERLFWFDWSPDGSRMAYARGAFKHNVVLIENF